MENSPTEVARNKNKLQTHNNFGGKNSSFIGSSIYGGHRRIMSPIMSYDNENSQDYTQEFQQTVDKTED